MNKKKVTNTCQINPYDNHCISRLLHDVTSTFVATKEKYK